MSQLEKYSEDSLLNGRLVCRQPRQGYRFSVDAVLLAHFVTVKKNARIVDLGAGCGIIGLLLCYRHYHAMNRMVAVELQQELAQLAAENFHHNGYQEKTTVLQSDISSIAAGSTGISADLVVCNPPYYRPGSGRKNSNAGTCQARHQLSAGLADFIAAASRCLHGGGIAAFIYPAEHLAELLILLTNAQLPAKIIRLVYSYPDAHPGCAQRVLVQCRKNSGQEARILPPLYLYQKKNGPYSPEIQAMYNDDRAENCSGPNYPQASSAFRACSLN